MNKYRLLFEIEKAFIFVGILLGIIFTGVLYTICISSSHPLFSVSNVYGHMALSSIPLFLIIGVITPAFIYKLLENYLMPLLPISPLCKYLFMVLSAITMCFLTFLMSLPMELIGSMLTANSSPNRQIVVGGMIRFFAQNGIFALSLTEVSVGLFTGMLFRNAKVTFMLVVCVSSGIMGYYMPYVLGVVEQMNMHIEVPMTVCIICILTTIAILTLGYKLFRRWQIANDGILSI